MLDICQQIEREAGRIRPRAADGIATGTGTGCQAGAGCNKTAGADHEAMGRQYGSRTLDIDILFYDDRVIDTPRLTVPHPLMQQRGFVLRPLCEVLPGFMHPVLHKSVRQLLDELSE
ncbi:MAG: 2-amino-4-hydroxy-6-hydroxymethyldihydropteridine diphosphokinase [Alistipes indistinctus]